MSLPLCFLWSSSLLPLQCSPYSRSASVRPYQNISLSFPVSRGGSCIWPFLPSLLALLSSHLAIRSLPCPPALVFVLHCRSSCKIQVYSLLTESLLPHIMCSSPPRSVSNTFVSLFVSFLRRVSALLCLHLNGLTPVLLSLSFRLLHDTTSVCLCVRTYAGHVRSCHVMSHHVMSCHL